MGATMAKRRQAAAKKKTEKSEYKTAAKESPKPKKNYKKA
jgi:hypothetical protein